MSKVSEKSSEKSEMSSAALAVQSALQTRIAPPSIGSVKARIRHAARKLDWSASRTKDAWYADPRISISAEELQAVEALAGSIRNGRTEAAELAALIARADALLGDKGPHLAGALVDAFRALVGALDRTGAAR